MNEIPTKLQHKVLLCEPKYQLKINWENSNKFDLLLLLYYKTKQLILLSWSDS